MPLTLARVAQTLLPSVENGHALARSELRTLARAAEVILEGAVLGVSPREVADNVDVFLVAGRSRRAWRIRVLLTIIEYLPAIERRRTFAAMTLVERRSWVRARWIDGRGLGRICGKVRDLVILGAYGDPRAAASTGYVPVEQRPRFRRSLDVVSDVEAS